MTNEQMKEVTEHMETIFVKKGDCLVRQEKINSTLANDDKRIELLTERLNMIIKLSWVVASATIGQLIIAFFNTIK